MKLRILIKELLRRGLSFEVMSRNELRAFLSGEDVKKVELSELEAGEQHLIKNITRLIRRIFGQEPTVECFWDETWGLYFVIFDLPRDRVLLVSLGV